ncbi:MAG: pyridoxal 5'-phosphate synthase glutaminase subunit PdxT [Candidatus Peribacteraceae bacterium]|nr:pyridoxal 5'-phosphate synthase glutaminase subunit PdxT [Candidatus Peribacteraceae bacterium]
MIIGVLAFQGDFAEHIDVLKLLKIDCMEVRNVQDLGLVQGLIIPGGESTVMAKFLASTGVGKEIKRRVRSKNHPLVVYGTCAGAILLAKIATGKNAPETLGLLDITIERNAYGAQIDSFETTLLIQGIKLPITVSFIRAPKIVRVGKGIEILAMHEKSPVLVRKGNVMAGTFHPEVRSQTALHELFVGILKSSLA